MLHLQVLSRVFGGRSLGFQILSLAIAHELNLGATEGFGSFAQFLNFSARYLH
jgi:predicted alpha/beta hydrolase